MNSKDIFNQEYSLNGIKSSTMQPLTLHQPGLGASIPNMVDDFRNPDTLLRQSFLQLLIQKGYIQVGAGENAGGIAAGATRPTDTLIWGGASFANRDSAPFRILLNGNIVIS